MGLDNEAASWSESTDALIDAWNPSVDESASSGSRPSRLPGDGLDERLSRDSVEPHCEVPSIAAGFVLGSAREHEARDGSGPPARVCRPARSGSLAIEGRPASSRAFPRPGATLAGFRLLGELGRGAFARVYLAQQLTLGGRPVALKVAPVLGGEPESLARLHHAHIVPVHSVHDDPDTGLRLMCMPYFGGANLARVLENTGARLPSQATGESLVQALDQVAALEAAASHARPRSATAPAEPPPLWVGDSIVEADPTRGRSTLARCLVRLIGGRATESPSHPSLDDGPDQDGEAQPARSYFRSHTYIQASVWIIARLAEALEHAHAHRLLHRDIKPSNVLIAADGTPMLLDFNLSTRLDDPADAASRARLGGTLPYMAPEHLDAFDPEGQTPPEAVDERSDLYALGLILFEVVAGHHPFHDPAPNLPLPEVIQAMRAERCQGAPSPRASNPMVPPSLDSIVRQCLAPNPSRRYQRAHDLAEDLRRFLDDLPLIHAPEPSLRERVAKWFRRHPEARSSTTIGTLALTLLLSLGLVGWMIAQRLEAASAAIRLRHFESAFRECQLLLNTASGPSEHLGRGLEIARRELAGYGVDDPARWAERPDVRHLARPARQALAENLAELALLRARAEVAVTDHAPEPVRRRALDSALVWLDRAEALDPGPSAALHLDRARYLNALGLGDRARAERAKAEAEPPRSAREHYLLGNTLARAGRLDAAEAHLARAVALDSRRFWAWFSLGLCHLDQGRDAEAAADFAACTILAPNFAWPHLNRGLALARAGRLGEALAAYDRAVALSPGFVEARLNRALVRLELDDPAGAFEDLDHLRRLGQDDAPVLAARAEALGRLGRRDQAAREFDAALAERPDDPALRVARGVFRRDHDPAGARDDFLHALAIDPAEPRALLGLAFLLRASDPRAALGLTDHALDASPGLVDALQLRALLRAHLGDPRAVADADALARTPSPHNLYNAACALAVLARTSHDDRLVPRALDYLRRALDAGFPREGVADDPDFAPLREHPEFRALLRTTPAS